MFIKAGLLSVSSDSSTKARPFKGYCKGSFKGIFRGLGATKARLFSGVRAV